ncbi:hypothetical protein M231_07236 [Tremella mesenterica]|uniref:Uncharacterized protein n=1 Tax=Tremella mesenterica TaxID=5217 RepID=A0A4Q1BCQ6_TREME|nr:hypothetical protein M231_07236 [Tremella mesenterica]
MKNPNYKDTSGKTLPRNSQSHNVQNRPSSNQSEHSTIIGTTKESIPQPEEPDYPVDLIKIRDKYKHSPPLNKALELDLSGNTESEIAQLWTRTTYSSVVETLLKEATIRFEADPEDPSSQKWFKNALERLAQGWRLRAKSSAVVRLEGQLCTDCERRMESGGSFRVGCIGPLNGVCAECSAKGTSKCSVKKNGPDARFHEGFLEGKQATISHIAFILESHLVSLSGRHQSLPSYEIVGSIGQISAMIHLFNTLELPLPKAHLPLYTSLHLIPESYSPPVGISSLLDVSPINHLPSTRRGSLATPGHQVAGPSRVAETPIPSLPSYNSRSVIPKKRSCAETPQ